MLSALPRSRKPPLSQSKMEESDKFPLRLWAQIDHDVATRNEIDPGKWGVRKQVLDSEDHSRPKVGQHAISLVLLDEEARQASLAQLRRDGGRINSLPGKGDRVRICVRREDLQLDAALCSSELLLERHPEGVGLLSGAAPGDPDAKRAVRRMVIDQSGNNGVCKDFEYGGDRGRSRSRGSAGLWPVAPARQGHFSEL